jgi:recombination protein RecA
LKLGINDLATTSSAWMASLASARETAPAPSWSLPELAGRLVEISGLGASASLTVAFGLVCDAQSRGEPVAWVSLRESVFFPPDAAASGADLSALAVVRVPSARAAARAGDELARANAFGLIVLDLGTGSAEIPLPLQTRLTGLAQKHDAAIVVLSEKPRSAPSIGSLVSLRVESCRREGFACEARALKDKRRGPGWHHVEVYVGPAGLR